VVQAVSSRFVPVKAHIKEQKATFERFNAQWTPTQILLDSEGVERHRIEGFLPVDDFLAQLELGLGKLHFQHRNYGEAEKHLRSVCESSPRAGAAPEACYWAGVSVYKGSNDPRHLGSTARVLKERYPDSEWTRKASVWLK
jgi:uncharacterized protein HemY